MPAIGFIPYCLNKNLDYGYIQVILMLMSQLQEL